MDYFGRRRAASSASNGRPLSRPNSRVEGQRNPPTPLETPRTPYYDASGLQASRRPPPPMRIRRLPSSPLLDSDARPRSISGTLDLATPTTEGQRRRSLSAPQRPQSISAVEMEEMRASKTNAQLGTVAEEVADNGTISKDATATLAVPQDTRRRAASDAASSAAEYVLGRKRRSTSTSRPIPESHDYEAEVVDLLDVIDPEVSTLSMLNNVQNSLFIPNLGRFLNRLPTYDLSRNAPPLSRIPTADEKKDLALQAQKTESESASTLPSIFGAPLAHSHSISSTLSESNYAVLPHGAVLEGWSEQDKAELNDHVRHLLHSRKAGFKRSMKAFGKYVRTPLGAFVTIYAFLITFWGTAWVLFIIGWLSVDGRQAYFIEICDQVLTALFCVVGIGMSPFRAVDTYHMIYIAKYHYKTLRLRRERDLPPLPDENDLPEPGKTSKDDPEAAIPQEDQDELLLTPEEQAKFEYHRAKFCKSHTFYKPHETFTHRAFGIDLLITAVTLLDFHSMFQMALGGTTWGINYHHRPKALTAVILTCSICCNISAGLVISIGGKKTRKKEVVERLFRQALTEEALHKLEKKKGIKPSTNEDALAHVVNQMEAEAYEQHTVQQAGNIATLVRP